jgi:hypothetical protein
MGERTQRTPQITIWMNQNKPMDPPSMLDSERITEFLPKYISTPAVKDGFSQQNNHTVMDYSVFQKSFFKQQWIILYFRSNFSGKIYLFLNFL